MPDLNPWGQIDPFPFRITLNGDPVNLTLDTDIVDGDIYLVTQTEAQMAVDTYTTRQVDVSAEVTKITAGSHYAYYWKPASNAEMQVNWAMLLIEDVSGGGLFDANSIVIFSGGTSTARYSGTVVT